MIHADAGPKYAERHQWATAPLSALSEIVPYGPVVVDQRLTVPEMAAVTEIVSKLPRSHPVYFKVVDPYWECIQQPYYQFLLRLTRFQNVLFVGPYHECGFTGVIRQMAGPATYLHLPYAYESARELPLEMVRRKKTLAFSGATDPTYYPERDAVSRQLRRRWFGLRQISILSHPGYPDVGHTQRHSVIGPAYLQFLAQHQFMYVEPSRDSLEFLKYSECAYAGCVPVGRPPASFGPELARLVLPLDSNHLWLDYRKLCKRSPEEVHRIALDYRQCLKQQRDPQQLNTILVAHWLAHAERLR